MHPTGRPLIRGLHFGLPGSHHLGYTLTQFMTLPREGEGSACANPLTLCQVHVLNAVGTTRNVLPPGEQELHLSASCLDLLACVHKPSTLVPTLLLVANAENGVGDRLLFTAICDGDSAGSQWIGPEFVQFLI